MRKFAFISVFVVTMISQSWASHILGGEITYEHIDNLKYKVWVTIYRNCEECKIAGGGGGSSSKECDNFDLYVHQSDRYSCSNTYLEKFSLTRQEIRPIIPVCTSVKTKCDSNSNFGYGIEAHVFYAIVDFSKYGSSASCGFDMYVRIFDRASDIDNINGKEQSFYNYAFINPAFEQNSPVFEPNPTMVIPVNQPLRTVISRSFASGDSIVYTTGVPLSDHKSAISFADDYSQAKPLTVWCNGSTICKADESANPPIGYSLNAETGALSFTPTSTGEKAVLVYEASIHRKVGSAFKLIGVVRRDIQIVTAVSENNAPKVTQGSRQIHLCVGDDWNIDVEGTDKPVQLPDGSTAAQQTVSFELSSDITNLNFKQVNISQAPYRKLELNWTPSTSLARDKPYHIYVTIKDDNCPLNASQTVLYEVFVHPKPDVTMTSKKLWCANIEAKIVSNDKAAIKSSKLLWSDKSGNQLRSTSATKDTFLANSQLLYRIESIVENSFGCKSKLIDSVQIDESDLNGLNLKITGKDAFCVGDKMSLITDINSTASVQFIKWFSGPSQVAIGNKYDTIVRHLDQYTYGIQVTALGNKGELQCVNSTYFNPVIGSGPDIKVDNNLTWCAKSDIDLSSIVQPGGGVWKAISHEALAGNMIRLSKLVQNTPNEVCQTYEVIKAFNGCKSVDTVCVRVNPLPVLKLNSATICNFEGHFNLANLITQPFGLGKYEIQWKIDGKNDMYTFEDGKYLLPLVDLGNGNHMVTCSIANEYGCSTTGVTNIVLIKDLEITGNIVETICQEDSSLLDDLFNISPLGGFWSSPSNFDGVYNHKIAPEFCGKIDLKYSYDRYGCFAEADFVLDVKCKPEIQIGMPDSICQAFPSLELKGFPEGGIFVGPNVTGNMFSPHNLLGDVLITYMVESDGCTFTKSRNIFVGPAPVLKYAKIPKIVCKGDKLEIKDLILQSGSLIVTIGSERFNLTEGFYSNISHVLTPSELQKGSLKVEMVAMSHLMCEPFVVSEVVEIKDVPLVKLNKWTYEACAPFNWKPEFTNSGSVNWNRTTVDWNFGDFESGHLNIYSGLNPVHQYEQAGIYDVRVSATSEDGCTFDTTYHQSITVHQTPIAQFDALPDRPVSVRLPEVWFVNKSIGDGKLTYHWDFGTIKARDTSNLVSPKFYFIGDTGSYIVSLKVMNEFGCFSTAEKTVKVGQDIQMFIPNAFTPNGKGPELTEQYKVIGNNVRSFEMEIVNRWGERVYVTNDINAPWDGRFHGEMCMGGIYAYKIRAISNTGGEYDFVGILHLIR